MQKSKVKLIGKTVISYSIDLEKWTLSSNNLSLQYFGHLMRRANSLGKTLMLRKTEGRRRRRWQRMRWLESIIDSMNLNLSKL